eukprot:TRINITY_DN1967_c0_g1_i2.p2 TRINITY_DN1967_c0_g1~~TRINITY_DN1967_c0_g1_i2.p2  ORF type:complete len:178 (-),score=45.61 TRINITY_DN1967_c0_g1_i2:949-1482(-)
MKKENTDRNFVPQKKTDKIGTPADRSFWLQFYENGEGSEPYEWYTSLQAFEPFVLPLLSPGQQVLHIGCGNSQLTKNLLHTDHPNTNNLIVYDVDYCPEVLFQTLDIVRREENPQKDLHSSKHHKKQNSKQKQPKAVHSQSAAKTVSSWQHNFVVADATLLPFRDQSFDVILDKDVL